MSEARTTAWTGSGQECPRSAVLPEWYEAALRGLKVTVGHPVLKIPVAEVAEEMWETPEGQAKFVALMRQREELIGLMESDPLRHGYRPFMWERAEGLIGRFRDLLIMGGNRSAKTEFAARFAVHDLVQGAPPGKPPKIWAFLHSSGPASIQLQHPRIYKFLPPEWRARRVGQRTHVSFTEKNGFSDGIFILPNGSKGLFFNYMQDVKVLEGYELDGVWCDELVPLPFLEALDFRLATRKGVMLVTFTPVTGFTPVVGKYLAGALVVESRPSALLPGKNVRECPEGHMPYVMECVSRSAAVMFFFTEFNPFNPYEEMVRKLEGASDKDRAMRAYGWVDKAVGNAFPKFGSAHIVSRAKLEDGRWKMEDGKQEARREPRPTRPAFAEGGLVPARPWVDYYPALGQAGTNYRVADPGVAKNWFLCWYRCSPEPERTFLYREFPDRARHGWWAEPGEKPDGKHGPAQRLGFGGGIVDIKRTILEAEGWIWDEGEWDGSEAEVIFASYIDPRMGGAEVPSEEEGTSLIQLMADEQRDKDGSLIGPSMIWTPAPGGQILDGIQLVNDRFAYDEDRPVNALNCPRMFVVEDCQQSIYAFREYTGLDGQKGALKDVVDPTRYFVKADVGYVEPGSLGSSGGGSY